MRAIFIALFLFCAQGQLQGKSICVSLLVKQNLTYLKECLDSVEEIADCIAISTEEGLSQYNHWIIEEFVINTGMPTRIEEKKAPTEKERISFAQKTLLECDLDPEDTHILFLDSGQTLTVRPEFNKHSLTETSYRFLEEYKSLSFSCLNGKLIHASRPEENSKKLNSLCIEDQEDAAFHLKKQIFAVQEQPENLCALLLLALAHKSLKHYDNVLFWFKSRIEKEGDPEEVWFAKWMIGECYEAQNAWENALNAYLEAYQFWPQRREPLRKIANYYRLRGKNDLSYLFAKQGARIPSSDAGHLFSYPPLSDYEFDEEISIAAYYTQFKEDGYTASSDLMIRKHVPAHIKEQAFRNVLFYVEPLKNAHFLPIQFDFPLIQEGDEERYHPMNPSIEKTTWGYKVICRTVNYTQTGAKSFHTSDKTGIFRTRNFLLHYDTNFHLLSEREILENLPRKRVRSWISANIQGLDDCRIFCDGAHSWFTCTASDTNPTGNFQIALCKLGEEKNNQPIHVEKLTPLLGPDPNRCEKNWLPFFKDDLLHLIYSYDPFMIVKPDPETGACTSVLEYSPQHDFSRFRGSAAPIPFDQGFLILVHEVALLPDYSRVYLHRFVLLDKTFIITRVSRPFIFDHQGVEYCCSMTLDHSGKNLILPIGLEDREARLCIVDTETVRSLLNPLPS